MQDKIDILYQRKKFFKIIFPKINKWEYIRIFQKREDNSKTTFWNDIDDMNTYIEKFKFNTNTYFSLATTDGQGGTITNIKHRYCIGLDFDKKLDSTLDTKEILLRFRKLNIWYHCIIDSGNGYHVYICIQETSDIEKVIQVTKILGQLLRADCQAELNTQILRVPLTYNLKDNVVKQVNIIHMFDKNTIKPYDINKLYDRFVNINKVKNNDINIQYALKNTKIPPCIINILKGIEEGDRNWCLKRLISYFKLYGYNKNESNILIKEWNSKCTPPMSESELEYQFDYIWEKPYKCFGCRTRDKNILNKINKYCNKDICRYRNNNSTIDDGVMIEYKILKRIEKSRRKNVVQIKGNEFLILMILKYNEKGLHTSEILKELTYKGKTYMNKITLNKYLKNLLDKKYIEKVNGNKSKGEENLYISKEIRTDDLHKINISFFCILGVLRDEITAEDLRIYSYIKYRLQESLSVTENVIADNLGIAKSTVSLHIANLVDTRYIDIVGKDRVHKKYGFNIYRLNV